MELTYKEIWTALHGMVLGAGFLVLFSGGFVAIRHLGTAGPTPASALRQLRGLSVFMWLLTLLVWATVVLGTYMIYPWYRAKPPEHTAAAALADYPKYLLVSKPQTKEWHEFGMEWKEHIGWLAPILLTAVTFILTFYGRLLISRAGLRRMVLALFTIAFLCASVAGVLGALLNKAAPTR